MNQQQMQQSQHLLKRGSAAPVHERCKCCEPVGVACNEPDDVACNEPDDVACNEPVDVACNEPVDVACNEPVDVACEESVPSVAEQNQRLPKPRSVGAICQMCLHPLSKTGHLKPAHAAAASFHL